MSVETHKMPSGAVVYYRDSDHQYNESSEFKRDGRIPGISTVAKAIDPMGDPLIDWGSKLSLEGAAREIRHILIEEDGAGTERLRDFAASGETIWNRLKDDGATWRQIREEAGFRGADAHDVLLALAEDREALVKTPYDEAVVAWWEERDPQVLQCEQVVFANVGVNPGLPSAAFAGRFDLRCQVDVDGQTETWLLDCKTSKYLGVSFAAQLNLYLVACEQAGFGGAERLVILQAREDATWREVEVPKNTDWAMCALAAYNANKAIGKSLRASQKAAEAASEQLGMAA